MGFVNEFISEDDYKRTGIKDIAKRFAGPITRSWTIDRERNIWLHMADRGREEYSADSTWLFYWRGKTLVVWLTSISITKNESGVYVEHTRLRRIDIPEDIAGLRDEILADLKEALAVDGSDGLYRKAYPYEVILDVY